MTSNLDGVGQLGARLLVLDKGLQSVVSTTSVGYFQPEGSNVNMPDVVAVRMTLTLDDVDVWDDDMVDAIQLSMGPKDVLSSVEVALVVADELEEIQDDLTVYYQEIADFMNSNCATYSELQRMIEAVLDSRKVSVGDISALVSSDDDGKLKIITGSDVRDLSTGQLSVVAKLVSRHGSELTEAMTAVLGAAYFSVDPLLSACFDPFATAVSCARSEFTDRLNREVTQKAMNYDKSVKAIVESGEIHEHAVVEVVRVSDLCYDRLNYLTDQSFSDGELSALAVEKLGGDVVDLDALKSAQKKLEAAAVADDIDWIAMANGRGDDEDNYNMYKGIGSWTPVTVTETDYLGELAKCAFFFYGRRNAGNTCSEQSGDNMFAYTSAVGFPVPNRTTGGCATLLRDSSATAKGSITARLEVESFIRAYHAFLGVLIRKRLGIDLVSGGCCACSGNAQE